MNGVAKLVPIQGMKGCSMPVSALVTKDNSLARSLNAKTGFLGLNSLDSWEGYIQMKGLGRFAQKTTSGQFLPAHKEREVNMWLLSKSMTYPLTMAKYLLPLLDQTTPELKISLLGKRVVRGVIN